MSQNSTLPITSLSSSLLVRHGLTPSSLTTCFRDSFSLSFFPTLSLPPSLSPFSLVALCHSRALTCYMTVFIFVMRGFVYDFARTRTHIPANSVHLSFMINYHPPGTSWQYLSDWGWKPSVQGREFEFASHSASERASRAGPSRALSPVVCYLLKADSADSYKFIMAFDF